MPPAEPSAFGDLADQVEGVMGESERRWQARVELSHEWYWETDESHRLSSLSADAPIVKPAGRALGDLLGRRHDELSFVQPPGGGWPAFNLMLDRHEGFRDLELEVDGLGGHARGWMSLTGRPRFHRDGRFAGFEGVGHDITVHKESFRRLQASEQRFAVLAGLSADWYWATDSRAPLHRAPMKSCVAAWATWRCRRRAARAGSSTRTHSPRRSGAPTAPTSTPGGPSTRWSSTSRAATARRSGCRSAARHASTTTDVSSATTASAATSRLRKKAEQMLIVHNRQLQSAVTARTRELELANRDLEAFARHLAHELRTPIGHVQGLAELLRRRLGEPQRGETGELLDLQVRAAQEMLTTLEALLALARSSSEAIERADVDLSHLAEEVIAGLPPVERAAPVLWQIEPGTARLGQRIADAHRAGQPAG